MRWLLVLCAIVLAISLAGWQYLSLDRPGDDRSLAGPPEPTAPVSSGQIQGIGFVEPISEVRRLMMRTGGVIKHCYVHAGQRVRKGEPVMELENRTQQAELEVARKNLELIRAEATHAKAGINPYRIRVAERTAERLREKLRHWHLEAIRSARMVQSRAASSQELEFNYTQRQQAEVELREQEAELEHLRHNVTPEHKAMLEARIGQAQANVELAAEKLQETKLLAPFDGTVLKLLKREGEGIRSSEPEAVVLFGDMSCVRVRAEIDERFVRRLEVGQAATVFGRNLAGKTFAGRVACMENLMGNKTVFTRASSERKDLDVLQVLIDLEPGFHAPAGLQVDVKIESSGGP
jgi:HlyD family secretion protein